MKITTVDLRRKLDAQEAVQIVDVRGASEFATGHIPGAISIPMEEIESRLPDLKQNGAVVLVCQSGNRAEITCEILAGRHPELMTLDGGTDAWIDQNLPVVSSTQTRWSLERQTRLGAGVLVLIGVVLSLTVHPAWIYLCAFIGAGLTFAGLTNICGMAFLLGRMPWNKARALAPFPSPGGQA